MGTEMLAAYDAGCRDFSHADLSGTDLRETDLSGTDLRNADLSNADLRGTDLRETDLRGAKLSGTDLRNADLRRADLRGTDLRGAKLSGPDLRGLSSSADLRNADLRETDLRETDLRNAYLRNADLRSAAMNMADLRGTDLRGAKLSGTDLSGADLRETDLRETDLRNADLSNAILRSAAMFMADLRNAYLSGADLRGATDLPAAPVIPNIDAAILAEIVAGGVIDMDNWHTCETTHCRAGWAIHLADEAGAALEREYGANVAGALIYAASRPNNRVPNWFASAEEALAVRPSPVRGSHDASGAIRRTSTSRAAVVVRPAPRGRGLGPRRPGTRGRTVRRGVCRSAVAVRRKRRIGILGSVRRVRLP